MDQPRETMRGLGLARFDGHPPHLGGGDSAFVFAWREPSLFVDGYGAETLHEAGVEIVEIPDLAELVQAINGHLFD